MAGVFRPYTLVDVLGTLNQQNNNQNGAEMVNGLGNFAETDETIVMHDSMATVVQVNATWDGGQWGSFTWG